MDFGKILGQITGAFQAGGGAIVSQLQPWVMRFMGSAAQKWLPMSLSGVRCGLRNPDGRRCQEAAVAPCMLCGESVCINHGFVDYDADLVCFSCIGQAVARSEEIRARSMWGDKQERGRAFDEEREARRAARERGDPHAAGHTHGAPRPPSPEAQRAQLIAWASAILEVSPSAEWKVVKDAHRRLSKDTHPDRGGSEERFKEVQKAFEVLKQARGQ